MLFKEKKLSNQLKIDNSFTKNHFPVPLYSYSTLQYIFSCPLGPWQKNRCQTHRTKTRN